MLGGGSVWFNGRLFGGNPKAKVVWKYHRYVWRSLQLGFLLDLSDRLRYVLCNSLSGYVLFPLFLLAAHLGGAWSNWSVGNSAYVVRLLAFTVSPIVLFAAVLVRVRSVSIDILAIHLARTSDSSSNALQDIEDAIPLNFVRIRDHGATNLEPKYPALYSVLRL